MVNGGKVGGPAAISPNQALELTRKANEAHQRATDSLSKAVDNEKRIIELEKTVNDKSQWNNTVRGWMNKSVNIELVSGREHVGTLLGIDRYTLTISEDNVEVIVHKGAIATIRLA